MRALLSDMIVARFIDEFHISQENIHSDHIRDLFHRV
jgi:hypothetical protein